MPRVRARHGSQKLVDSRVTRKAATRSLARILRGKRPLYSNVLQRNQAAVEPSPPQGRRRINCSYQLAKVRDEKNQENH